MSALPDPAIVRGEPCPAGYHYEWVVEPAVGWLAWLPTDEGKRCRFTNGGSRCENTAVAKLNRRRVGEPIWWHYCAEHLYGRAISGQRVWVIHTIRDDEGGVND